MFFYLAYFCIYFYQVFELRFFCAILLATKPKYVLEPMSRKDARPRVFTVLYARFFMPTIKFEEIIAISHFSSHFSRLECARVF